MKIRLSDIKKDAKKLKKEMGIRHTEALNIISKEAGFNNYAEALKALTLPIDDKYCPVHPTEKCRCIHYHSP